MPIKTLIWLFFAVGLSLVFIFFGGGAAGPWDDKRTWCRFCREFHPKGKHFTWSKEAE